MNAMTAEPLRVAFRRQVRERAVEHARSLAVAHGWEQVRMGEVAMAVGVSRPTLYKEFGDKQGLGEALVRAETDRFLVGVCAALDASTDVNQGIADAVAYTLDEAASSPLLHAVLTSTRGDAAGLLSLLTTRSAPLLEAASDVLDTWLRQRLPDHDADDIEECADVVVRLVVSHLVQSAAPRAQTATRLARAGMRMLRLPG